MAGRHILKYEMALLRLWRIYCTITAHDEWRRHGSSNPGVEGHFFLTPYGKVHDAVKPRGLQE
jgi:hypothetical protein